MAKRAQVFSLLAAALVVLLYQNCDQRGDVGPVADPLVVKLDDEIRTFSGLSLTDRETLCHETNYVCVEKHFAPGLAYSSSVSQACVELETESGVSKICFDHKIFNYDTTEAINACSECTLKDSEAGGRYNFSEVECYNPKIQTAMTQQFAISRETGELAVSLRQTVELCEKAGAK